MGFYKVLGIVLFLGIVGCGTNIRKTSQHQDKGSLDQKGFFDENIDLDQPSLDIQASGNATINVGDQAIRTKLKTETKKQVSTSTVWDMKLEEVYDKFSSWVYIGIALAFLIAVYAWKNLEKTTAGKAFTTAGAEISNLLRHCAP